MTSEERNIIEKLRLQVEQLEKALSEKDARISSLEQILYKLRHQMYGKKSEKNLPTDPNALMPSLFGDELSEQEKKEIEKEAQKEEEKLTKTITVTVSKRKKINRIRRIERTCYIGLDKRIGSFLTIRFMSKSKIVSILLRLLYLK